MCDLHVIPKCLCNVEIGALCGPVELLEVDICMIICCKSVQHLMCKYYIHVPPLHAALEFPAQTPCKLEGTIPRAELNSK